MATKRLELDSANVGRKASIQCAHLTLNCGEPRERLGDCSCSRSVVADDQLSRFLGELLRSRQMGGNLSVRAQLRGGFRVSPSSGLTFVSAISNFVAARAAPCQLRRGER